jgi:hypothetical protein
MGLTLVVNLTVDYALRNAFVMTVTWLLVGLLVSFHAVALPGAPTTAGRRPAARPVPTTSTAPAPVTEQR